MDSRVDDAENVVPRIPIIAIGVVAGSTNKRAYAAVCATPPNFLMTKHCLKVSI
jgi:hypothetical protein